MKKYLTYGLATMALAVAATASQMCIVMWWDETEMPASMLLK